MDACVLWVWLAESVGAGSAVWAKLYQKGYSVSQVYQSTKEDLLPLLPRQKTAVEKLAQKSTAKAEAIVQTCHALGIRIVHFGHPEYPASLLALKNPPAVLYVKGNLSLSAMPFPVGIVGTRHPSDYGIKETYALSTLCAKEGGTVVSGLALGIDTVAHLGALAVGGKTVAVLASGVDAVTPLKHQAVAEHICQNGALVSEYPPGTAPRTYHFPCRNRLVAAMSSALAVMEGSLDSGAMITAKDAMSLEKPLYALPGRVGESQAEGPMQLLSKGARLLLDFGVILRDHQIAFAPLSKPDVKEIPSLSEAEQQFGLSSAPSHREKKTPLPKEAPPKKQPKAAPDLSFLTEEEKALYFRIPEDGTCLPDELVTEGATAVLVMRWLTHLEMEGLILRHAGGRVSRA